jgi:hypothetical protein
MAANHGEQARRLHANFQTGVIMTTLAATNRFEVEPQSQPDEDVQPLNRIRIELVQFDGFIVRRFWVWTGCIRRGDATERLLVSNSGYALSGQLTVRTSDGIEKRIVAGDSYSLPLERDAWVEGNQPFVALEVSSVEQPADLS